MFISHNRCIPTDVVEESSTSDKRSVRLCTKAILSIPAAAQLSVVEYLSVFMAPMALIQTLVCVAFDHAVVWEWSPLSFVPIGCGLMVFESMIDAEHSGQTALSFPNTESGLPSDVGNGVAHPKPRRELAGAAQATDSWHRVLEVRFASYRAVDKGRDRKRFNRFATDPIVRQGHVAVEIVFGHRVSGLPGCIVGLIRQGACDCRRSALQCVRISRGRRIGTQPRAPGGYLGSFREDRQNSGYAKPSVCTGNALIQGSK